MSLSSPSRAWWIALLALSLAACGTPADEPDADTDAVADTDVQADALDTAEEVTGADADDVEDAADDADAEDAEPPHIPVNGFRVVFFDVGQGDAILVQTGTGESLLVDGGPSSDRLKDRLKRLGVENVDVLVATHTDADHVGGLPAALGLFNFGEIWWNGETSGTQVFKDFQAAVLAEEAPINVAKRGDTIELGNFPMTVLNPGPNSEGGNNASVVLSFGCPGARVLLTGDAEFVAEDDMTMADVLEDVDILKVSHHGANSATSKAFLDIVKPELGILSVGTVNAFDHPTPETVARLEDAGVELWRTDVTDGDDSLELVTDCETPFTVQRLGSGIER